MREPLRTLQRRVNPPRAEQRDARRAEHPLMIEQRREAVWRARAHAEEVLDLLGTQGVPMPLTKQRLKEVCEWGEGLLNRGVEGRPRDELSCEIQAGLDAQRDAAMNVQDARNRTDEEGVRLHLYYPFENPEQERVSMALEAMQLSGQQTVNRRTPSSTCCTVARATLPYCDQT